METEGRLLAVEDALASAGSFEPLYAIIRNELGPVRNIGPLTAYDIATRIASYLGWQPERVFLHAGAAMGARAIGIRARVGVSVPQEVFPVELQGLPAYHLENLLCIFKAELAGAPLRAEGPAGCGDLPLGPACGRAGRRRRPESKVF